MKTQNRTQQSNITVNSTTSHLHHIRFLLMNTLNLEFSATDYCVTLYKDISIASPWGPWVFSRYWDGRLGSDPRAVSRSSGYQAKCRPIAVFPQSAYCRVFCKLFSQHLGVFLLPSKADIHRKTVLLLWFVILLWCSNLYFFFNILDLWLFLCTLSVPSSPLPKSVW